MSDQPIDQRPPDRRAVEIGPSVPPAQPVERARRGRTVPSSKPPERAQPKEGVEPTAGLAAALARPVDAAGRAADRDARRRDPRAGRTGATVEAFLDVRPDDPNSFSPEAQERVFRDMLHGLEGGDPTDALGRKARRVVRENLRLLRLYRQHANALIGG